MVRLTPSPIASDDGLSPYIMSISVRGEGTIMSAIDLLPGLLDGRS